MSNFSSIDAIHVGGSNVKITLPFSSDVNSDNKLKTAFKELRIYIKDANAPFKTILEKVLQKQDILFKDANQNDLSEYTETFDVGDATKVHITAIENSDDSNDKYNFPKKIVDILRAPSPPSVSSSSVTVGLSTSNDSAVDVSAVITVTPLKNENVNRAFLIFQGIDKDGNSVLLFSDRVPVTTDQAVTFTLNKSGNNTSEAVDITAQLKSLKPDSAVKISAVCEANSQLSSESNSVIINTSIRSSSPVLISAKSLQNNKITVTGSVKKNGSQTTNYSILAQQIPPGATLTGLTPTEWKPTNVTSFAVSQVQTGDTFSFIQDITSVNGNPLNQGKAYAFVAIQHTAAIDPEKSIDIAATTNRPPLDQSAASNIKTAVTIKYRDASLAIRAGNQTPVLVPGGTTLQSLSFAPEFYSIAPPVNNVPAPLFVPDNEINILTFIFSSVKRPEVINTITNQNGNSTVPQQTATYFPFRVQNPINDDQYTILCNFTANISINDSKYIEGSTELPYTVSNNFAIVDLGSVFTKVKRSKQPSEVPKVSDLQVFTVKLTSNNVQLAAKWKTDYDSNLLDLTGIDVEVCPGIASLNDFANPFKHGSTTGLTTLSVGKAPGGDIYDSSIFNLFSTSQEPISSGKVYSVRVRPVYMDKDSNSPVTGEWLLSSGFQVPAALLLAPTNVKVSNIVSNEGKSFEVSYTIPKQKDITEGAPSTWVSGWNAVPESITITLYNRRGGIIAQKTKVYSETDSVITGYNATGENAIVDKVEFLKLTNVVAGEVVYAEGQVTYYNKGQIPRVTQVGSVSDRNIVPNFFEVPFAVRVVSATLKQNPPSNKQTGDRLVDEKLDVTKVKLQVTAVVDDGGMSGTIVKVIMPGFPSGSTAIAYQHELTYDASLKQYISGNITPVDLNYALPSTPVVVYAVNNNSSNFADVTLVE